MTPFRLSARSLTPRHTGVQRPEAVAQAAAPASPASLASRGAIPVPWRVTKRSLGVIEIEHRGAEAAHSVRFALSGDGMLGLSLPRTVSPGERVRVVVRGRAADGARAASDAMLVLRWFQPDGTELLWPIALA